MSTIVKMPMSNVLLGSDYPAKSWSAQARRR